MIKINVNGIEREVDVPSDTPLLWVIREELGLVGTKFGCGVALCGACTVHIDGVAVRSCVTPASDAADKDLTTIEGVVGDDGALHSVQEAWIAENVPQCGYCQSGQIMSALAMLRERKGQVSDEDIDDVMSANICRCGTYPRIRKAIKRAAAAMIEGETP